MLGQYSTIEFSMIIKVFYSVLSNIVVASHLQLLSTSSAARVTEKKMKF